MARSRNRNEKIVPGAEPAIDALKYEIATNLGLQDIIDNYGWTRLTTIDAGNVGGAIQQIINELGQRELIRHYKEGTIKDICHLSPGTQPNKYDLTTTRLINTMEELPRELQESITPKPRNPQVEPAGAYHPTIAEQSGTVGMTSSSRGMEHTDLQERTH